MEKRLKILSFFMVMFFSLNVFCLTGFFDVKNIAIEGSAIEQIYSSVSIPTDILGNMMSQKAQNKAPCNEASSKDSKKETAKIAGYAVIIVTAITILFWSFVLCIGGRISEQLTRISRYPLKIPWRVEIFLLLMMKILFNVRPRAGDIYVYNYAVKKGLC